MSKYSLKNLLSESLLQIDRPTFENIIDRFANEGYQYISLDSNNQIASTHSILMWLEDNFGEGAKAFTYKPLKKESGDAFSVVIYATPGDQSYYFEDVDEEDLELLRGSGQLNEEQGEYVDPLDDLNIASGTDVANRFAEIGARYIDNKELGDIERDFKDGVYAERSDRGNEYSDDVTDILKYEKKPEDTLVFTYFRPERVFLTWDGKWLDNFFMSDFKDMSDTEDVETIISAGQLREAQQLKEALDLEDPKVGDTFDTYVNNIHRMIDPIDYDIGAAQSFSTENSYKYGSNDSAGTWIEDKENIKSLPAPIREELEDVFESSWIKETSFENATVRFFIEYPELEQKFYGIEDVDPQMMRDAGYEEEAYYWEDIIQEYKINRIDDNFEIRFGSSIQTNFDRDPNSIYIYIYSQLIDYSNGDEDAVVDLDLGKEYNNIDSPEALRAAVEDFKNKMIPKFMKGDKPAKVAFNESKEALQVPLNESLVEFEELVNQVASYPLHYIDLQDTLELEMIADIIDSGKVDHDNAVDEYIQKTISKHLEKLDRAEGFIDKDGNLESDEGHFTMLGSDFWQELGYFINSDQWSIYTSQGKMDTYTLTGQQVDDIIDAADLNEIVEQKDVLEAEESDYNPAFVQIDEVIEHAIEELSGIISPDYDIDVQELTSGEGSSRYADGGFKAYASTPLDQAVNDWMPTQEADEKLEKAYKDLLDYTHEDAVFALKKLHPEVWIDLSGDPDMITYEQLEAIADAISDDDPERSEKYQAAAEELRDIHDEYMREEDSSWIYYEVDINYFEKNNSSNESGEPLLIFRGSVGDTYKTFAEKEVKKTFESEEEMEKVLEEGSLEIEEWFGGKERAEKSYITEEEVDESREDAIYELVKQEAQKRITPGFYNPEEDFDPDSSSRYSDVRIFERIHIPFSEYLNGTLTLPEEFETNVVEEMYIVFYKQAEQEVFSNIEEYLPAERSKEFTGIEDEIGEMFISGDLRDIDPNLYEEISYEIQEIANRYSEESGVHRGFEGFIDNDKKTISFTAEVSVDPEYQDLEKKKEVEITFDEADQIPAIIQQMDEWLQGN